MCACAVLEFQVGELDVKIEVEIPDALVEQLELDTQVCEEIIVLELYRLEKISGGKAAELLGITLYELRGLLGRAGVEFKYDVQEIKEDTGGVSGGVLINTMQVSTCRDLDIESKHEPMPVRDISL